MSTHPFVIENLKGTVPQKCKRKRIQTTGEKKLLHNKPSEGHNKSSLVTTKLNWAKKTKTVYSSVKSNAANAFLNSLVCCVSSSWRKKTHNYQHWILRIRIQTVPDMFCRIRLSLPPPFELQNFIKTSQKMKNEFWEWLGPNFDFFNVNILEDEASSVVPVCQNTWDNWHAFQSTLSGMSSSSLPPRTSRPN